MIIQSATMDKISELLPKGSKLLYFDDDGLRLFIAYEFNGVGYKTTVKSTSYMGAQGRKGKVKNDNVN